MMPKKSLTGMMKDAIKALRDHGSLERRRGEKWVLPGQPYASWHVTTCTIYALVNRGYVTLLGKSVARLK